MGGHDDPASSDLMLRAWMDRRSPPDLRTPIAFFFFALFEKSYRSINIAVELFCAAETDGWDGWDAWWRGDSSAM